MGLSVVSPGHIQALSLPSSLCPSLSLELLPKQQTLRCCAPAVPFKYAQKEVKGIVYILSFGIGVAIVRLSSLSGPNPSQIVHLALHQL